jgi:5-methylcytosine-specific restriction endonuclease McrA
MLCLTCKFETSNPKFCSRSCAARYNNTISPKRSQEGKCKACGVVTQSSRTYCQDCWSNSARSESMVREWLSGEWSGGTDKGLSVTIRSYLIEQADNKCSSCGFCKVHPDDGATILEINHINGDGTDHRKENLEVLCPNCHALTSTYRGRNAGNGRPVFYRRVSP